MVSPFAIELDIGQEDEGKQEGGAQVTGVLACTGWQRCRQSLGPCPLVMHYGLCIGQTAFGRCPRVEKEFNFSLVLDFEHDAFKIPMRHPRNI